jgi:hypothetical protein
MKERDYWEDFDVDGRIIFKEQLGWEGVAWIHLSQDRDQWWALVNTALYLGFHKMLGISALAPQLLDSEEGFS